jgi:hypothetical protein
VTLATRANVLVLVPVAAGVGRPAVAEVDLETLARSVVAVREQGSGARRTAEELLDELGLDPRTLTLGSNRAHRWGRPRGGSPWSGSRGRGNVRPESTLTRRDHKT